MTPEWNGKLYAHMEWADALLWTEVMARPGSSSDHFMRESLHHMHMVQKAYLSGFEERPADLKELTAFPDLGAVLAWGREFYPAMRGYLAGLSQEALVGVQ